MEVQIKRRQGVTTTSEVADVDKNENYSLNGPIEFRQLHKNGFKIRKASHGRKSETWTFAFRTICPVSPVVWLWNLVFGENTKELTATKLRLIEILNATEG